jgi:uncharacterized protein (DUF433 family)
MNWSLSCEQSAFEDYDHARLRSGHPCIRDLRNTVWDILKWLGTAPSHAQIISDYPELTEEDILAALQWAASLRDNTVVR